MADTPPPLPIITEKSRVGLRFSVRTWCVIITTGLGGILWAHTVYLDQKAVKEKQLVLIRLMDEHTESLRRIEDAVHDLQLRQRYGITSSLPKLQEPNP